MRKIIAIVATVFVFSFMGALTASAGSCNQVSGKSYYTDGVGYFGDAACHQEMTDSELNGSSSSDDTTTVIATGSGNCRYNTATMQYTDGTAYFSDSKCQNDAAAGERVAAPGTVAQTQTQTQAPVQTQAVAQVSTVSAAQYAEMSQKMAALEQRISILQSILTQVLALLAGTVK